jgi:predicted TIM-barrel fold metal-dependent hydrolase
MAELCQKYPSRFPSFVASLPLNNQGEALKEAERAVKQLGASGVQVFTNVTGKPLDDASVLPILEELARRDTVIWMHPTRGANLTDYASEHQSKFEIWWAFGWPYETSAAMARLVFSGIFDRQPELKIITHHMGGMVPYFEAYVRRGLHGGVEKSEEAAARLLQIVLCRHGFIRRGAGYTMRPIVLRRRQAVVRLRRAVRAIAGAVHTRNHPVHRRFAGERQRKTADLSRECRVFAEFIENSESDLRCSFGHIRLPRQQAVLQAAGAAIISNSI